MTKLSEFAATAKARLKAAQIIIRIKSWTADFFVRSNDTLLPPGSKTKELE